MSTRGKHLVVGPCIVCFFVALALVVAPVHTPTLAQSQPPQPVDQPPEFAAVRAKYEHMTREQYMAAGYSPDPMCITAAMGGLPPALGGMGVHANNRQLWEAQFSSGKLDPQAPPILLLNEDGRVVGLEWEAASSTQPPPVLFGQPVPLLPGHPGVEQPHYMFHAYFRPNGQVLFATWDPQLSCRVTAGTPPALPSAGEVPAPVALPNTGNNNLPALGLLVTALALLVLGIRLRRRYL